MPRTELICVGKPARGFLADGCAEYEKRLRPLCSFTVTELAEKRPAGTGEVQILAAIEDEGERILARLSKRRGAWICALCIEGKGVGSEQLARDLAEIAAKGQDAVFVIGGSWGLSDRVKRVANARLSMSDMTFPHQFARLLLSEQLYRAAAINSGIAYHK